MSEAMNRDAVERMAGVMPRYFGVWSATGVHVGVWNDGHIAHRVLADDYPYGEIKELVTVEDGGRFASTLLARAEAAEANVESWRSMWEKEHDHNEALSARLAEVEAREVALFNALADLHNTANDLLDLFRISHGREWQVTNCEAAVEQALEAMEPTRALSPTDAQEEHG